jgi:hypothetical protein
LSLGNAFNETIRGAGVDGDLVFLLTTNSGVTLNAEVVYVDTVPMGNLGDYNGDLTVNAADYVVYRNAKSGIGSLPAGSDDTPGVGVDDYVRWKTLYGTVYPAGSGSSIGGSDVPEPTTLVSLVFGLAVAGLARIRRRNVR